MTMDRIEAAVEKFRELLVSQCARAEKMKNVPSKKMNGERVKIGLIDGDGSVPSS